MVSHLCKPFHGMGERGDYRDRPLQGVFLIALLLPSSLLLLPLSLVSFFPILLTLKSRRNSRQSAVQEPGHFPSNILSWHILAPCLRQLQRASIRLLEHAGSSTSGSLLKSQVSEFQV